MDQEIGELLGAFGDHVSGLEPFHQGFQPAGIDDRGTADALQKGVERNRGGHLHASATNREPG